MKTVAALFIIFLVAGVASAQSKPQWSAESLTPKIKILMNYERDMLEVAEAHKGSPEFENAMNLVVAASTTGDYLDAARTLLRVYDNVSCDRDRARIQPLLKAQLSYYAKQTDVEIRRVNLALSYTNAQGIAATAVRMKDDMRDVKAKFEALEASLK
jgi:hypothetical protein